MLKLGMDWTDFIKGKKFVPDPIKDQFFLVDQNIIQRMVEFAALEKKDVVLEIGAGPGNLTMEIAKKAGKVIAFEIDTRFKLFLSRLPGNVEIHYESAWNFIRLRGKFKQRKIYNKIVANPPYSFIEPFIHNLIFLDYDKVILLVPGRFMKKTEKWGIFASFFEPKMLMEVPKENFYPVPKSNSFIIDLAKLSDPIETKNLGRFLRQYIYRHEGQLVKNSLMEGIIEYGRLVDLRNISKNEARRIVLEKDIGTDILDHLPRSSRVYELVETKFNNYKAGS